MFGTIILTRLIILVGYSGLESQIREQMVLRFHDMEIFFENTIASTLKSSIIPFIYKKNFDPEKVKKNPAF